MIEKKLGEEFSQLDYHYFILQLLYLVEYADYNAQVKLGFGYTNSGNTGPIKSGGCDTLGMQSGSVDGTDSSSMIYRGIENIYGNIMQFIDGINIKDYQAYVCYDKRQYESDKFDGCYQLIGYVNANTNGRWISKLGYDMTNPLVAFPVETNGTSNTYMTDQYLSQPGNRIARVGGLWNNNALVGLWNFNLGAKSSDANSFYGSRIVKLD